MNSDYYVLKDIPSVVSQELVVVSCRPSRVGLMDLLGHLRNDFKSTCRWFDIVIYYIESMTV